MNFSPNEVLDFWFPDADHQNSLETHAAFWGERMQGVMDARIVSEFADLTLAAAMGELDSWAETPRGRLALLIALDQFPRSLWRDTPAAYAQDIKATRLAWEGIENGHFSDLQPWEKAFFVIAIGHCEGPDHLAHMQRLDQVVEGIIEQLPDQLSEFGPKFRAQHARIKKVIETFGRHPHRNDILSRHSTPHEEHYIGVGDFPHLPKNGH